LSDNPPHPFTPFSMSPMSDHFTQVLTLIDEALGLNGRSSSFTPDTPLLGSLPELDSMAVATLLTAIEDHFGITIGDDEIDGSALATLGALSDFIAHKLA
jgi:acyl carrier protein